MSHLGFKGYEAPEEQIVEFQALSDRWQGIWGKAS